MRAIETVYRGYRFRSRLEARWAVFFNEIGIKWEYEPEGYHLSDGSMYLPDFWLPGFHLKHGVFVEVKPNGGDTSKAKQFAIDSDRAILLATGVPSSTEPMECLFTRVGDGFESLVSYPVWFGGDDGFYVDKTPFNLPRRSSEKLTRAATAARQARFEHGQVGAPSEWAR